MPSITVIDDDVRQSLFFFFLIKVFNDVRNSDKWMSKRLEYSSLGEFHQTMKKNQFWFQMMMKFVNISMINNLEEKQIEKKMKIVYNSSQFKTKKIIVGFDEARLFLRTLLYLRIFSLVHSLSRLFNLSLIQANTIFFSLTCHRFDRKKNTHSNESLKATERYCTIL